MAKVGIVGSRDYPHLNWVQSFVYLLPKDTIVVSGGARGVDKIAEESAIKFGLPEPIIFRVTAEEWAKSKGAGFRRNTFIAEECDILFAFWDEESKGTQDTMDKVFKMGKKVYWYGLTPERNKMKELWRAW